MRTLRDENTGQIRSSEKVTIGTAKDDAGVITGAGIAQNGASVPGANNRAFQCSDVTSRRPMSLTEPSEVTLIPIRSMRAGVPTKWGKQPIRNRLGIAKIAI